MRRRELAGSDRPRDARPGPSDPRRSRRRRGTLRRLPSATFEGIGLVWACPAPVLATSRSEAPVGLAMGYPGGVGPSDPPSGSSCGIGSKGGAEMGATGSGPAGTTMAPATGVDGPGTAGGQPVGGQPGGG